MFSLTYELTVGLKKKFSTELCAPKIGRLTDTDFKAVTKKRRNRILCLKICSDFLVESIQRI